MKLKSGKLYGGLMNLIFNSGVIDVCNKRSLKIISRSKLHFFINLISLTVSVILISISFFLFYSSDAINEYIQDNISISLFLKDEVSEERIQAIERELSLKDYSSKVEFISKDKAYDIFIEETGEDFRKILEHNPLPTSFDLYLKSEFMNKNSLKSISEDLAKIPEVSEVVSKMEFYEELLAISEKVKNYVLIITILMILTSVYLVFSTNRLIINSSSDEFETMKLVGAKLSAIKFPIILNIILVGLIAGLLACGFIYLIINFLELNLQSVLSYLNINKALLIMSILVVGPLLGAIITIFSLRKITLKIKT